MPAWRPSPAGPWREDRWRGCRDLPDVVAALRATLPAAGQPGEPSAPWRPSRALRHALAAAAYGVGFVLAGLGLPRVAAVVGAHMVLPVDPGVSPVPTEAELVYLADKVVVDDRVAGLDEREERALANARG